MQWLPNWPTHRTSLNKDMLKHDKIFSNHLFHKNFQQPAHPVKFCLSLGLALQSMLASSFHSRNIYCLPLNHILDAVGQINVLLLPRAQVNFILDIKFITSFEHLQLSVYTTETSITFSISKWKFYFVILAQLRILHLPIAGSMVSEQQFKNLKKIVLFLEDS